MPPLMPPIHVPGQIQVHLRLQTRAPIMVEGHNREGGPLPPPPLPLQSLSSPLQPHSFIHCEGERQLLGLHICPCQVHHTPLECVS